MIKEKKVEKECGELGRDQISRQISGLSGTLNELKSISFLCWMLYGGGFVLRECSRPVYQDNLNSISYCK